MNGAHGHRRLFPLLAIVAMLSGAGIAHAQTTDGPDLSIELVDPNVLRPFADPIFWAAFVHTGA